MRTFTALLTLSLAACTTPADQFRSVLPDDRLLIDESAFDDAALARGVGTPSDYYQITRDTVHDTNTTIGDVLRLVETITAFDPTWSDDDATALWGPWEDDGVNSQLWVTEQDDGAYDWAIQLKTVDATDWTDVLTGHVDAGATEDASSGLWTMDLTAANDIDPSDGATGVVSCEYALLPDGANVDVGFGQIADDGSLPADGAYHYETTKGVGGLMDLQINGDISDPPNGTAELLIIRSRWQGDGQGRADAYVTQGDLGALTYTESDCWDASHTTVYFENNYELVMDGDPAKCAFEDPSYNDAR
jgi:hypothetical protein